MGEREWGISRAERGSDPTRDAAVREWGIDGALARRLAAGPATRAALAADGIPPDAIDRRVRRGHIEALWPGVYVLAGPPISDPIRHRAALLACGPRSVLSSFNAAVEWALIDPARGSGELHVTVPATSHRRPRGITVHRATLTRAEVYGKDDLLITSPTRTLRDLAATHPRLLERAINEAHALRLLEPGDLEPLPGRRGARTLRRTLDARASGFDRSTAERLLLRLLRRAELPMPERNARIGRWEADLLWRHQRLVVETDGYAGHAGPGAFQRDRRKDRELKLAGYDVIRFTWQDLTDHPERTIATLAQLLLPRGVS